MRKGILVAGGGNCCPGGEINFYVSSNVVSSNVVSSNIPIFHNKPSKIIIKK